MSYLWLICIINYIYLDEKACLLYINNATQVPSGVFQVWGLGSEHSLETTLDMQCCPLLRSTALKI